jgi:dynein heavy chain
MRQLMLFLDEYAEIPYKVLHTLTSYVNYGGRVTDDKDNRTIDVILRDYFTPPILSDEYRFTPSGVYFSPTVDEDAPHKGFMAYIDSLPLNADPEVFGMHFNANITCDSNETDETLDIVVSLQPRAAGGGGKSRDEIVADTAKEISARLPEDFDIEAISMRYPVLYEESMNTVLVQECIRYNKLLAVMKRSLADIRKALVGLVVMSKDLDDMGSALHANKVPAMWEARAYPSLKPLNAWVTDLCDRLRFIGDWVAGGPPAVYWISGFFFPQAFLTGTLQNFARRNALPIDTLSFDFLFLNHKPYESISAKPADGCYIRGLFLEGARFDQDTGMLADSIPKQLFTQLPVIHLLPVPNRPKKTSGVYLCPVYKILSRWGVLATTGHSSNFVIFIELPTDKPTIANNAGDADCGYWIKAGVAAFTSLKF